MLVATAQDGEQRGPVDMSVVIEPALAGGRSFSISRNHAAVSRSVVSCRAATASTESSCPPMRFRASAAWARMTSLEHFRLAIVGAGPAGLAGAEFAARLGVSVAAD
jgi:hypothetical protein